MKSMKNSKIAVSSILDSILVETENWFFLDKAKAFWVNFYQIDFIIVRGYTVKKGLATNSKESQKKYKLFALAKS